MYLSLSYVNIVTTKSTGTFNTPPPEKPTRAPNRSHFLSKHLPASPPNIPLTSPPLSPFALPPNLIRMLTIKAGHIYSHKRGPPYTQCNAF